MLSFDCSTVKHGTQNTQNDCHQWLSDSLERTKFGRVRFSAWLVSGYAHVFVLLFVVIDTLSARWRVATAGLVPESTHKVAEAARGRNGKRQKAAGRESRWAWSRRRRLRRGGHGQRRRCRSHVCWMRSSMRRRVTWKRQPIRHRTPIIAVNIQNVLSPQQRHFRLIHGGAMTWCCRTTYMHCYFNHRWRL